MLESEIECPTHKHKLQKAKITGSYTCRGKLLNEEYKETCNEKSTTAKYYYVCKICNIKDHIEYCNKCATKNEIKLK